MKNIASCAIVFLLLSCSGRESGQSIDAAATEYLGALADGTLDGYLKHEKSYRDRVNSAKQGIPSDMWVQREASLRETAKAELRQNGSQNPYGWGGINGCYLIVRQGGTVKVKEVRPTPPGGWQVFYDISYGNQGNSPGVVLQNGKQRFFRSGVFSVAFEKSADGVPVAQSYCPAVDGMVTTWPVPPLTADEGVRIAKQTNAVPTQFIMQISRSAGVSSEVHWANWTEFVNAAQLLKSTLEKHGWSVSGFQQPNVGYYDIHGSIEPPDSARNWIVGPITNGFIGQSEGYNVVFLEQAETKLLSFAAQEDTGTASFSTQFSGCTAFCELWKDFATMPSYLGNSVFYGAFGKFNPSMNLDAIYTTSVNFGWDLGHGWYVQR